MQKSGLAHGLRDLRTQSKSVEPASYKKWPQRVPNSLTSELTRNRPLCWGSFWSNPCLTLHLLPINAAPPFPPSREAGQAWVALGFSLFMVTLSLSSSHPPSSQWQRGEVRKSRPPSLPYVNAGAAQTPQRRARAKVGGMGGGSGKGATGPWVRGGARAGSRRYGRRGGRGGPDTWEWLPAAGWGLPQPATLQSPRLALLHLRAPCVRTQHSFCRICALRGLVASFRKTGGRQSCDLGLRCLLEGNYGLEPSSLQFRFFILIYFFVSIPLALAVRLRPEADRYSFSHPCRINTINDP